MNHLKDNTRRWQRPFALFLLLSLLVTACVPSARPEPAQPTPTPTTEGVPPTLNPSARLDLPPAVVESDPPAGLLGVDSPVTFYFNQPMDTGTVEAALQVTPEVPGELAWLDAATLQFRPAEPFAPNTQVQFTLAETARSSSGLALGEADQFVYQTPGPLQVTERLPLPGTLDLDPTAAIAVTFNQPVVPLGADSADLPAAFTLEPDTGGRGEWLNTSTYIYYGMPALQGGEEYRLRLNPELTSAQGAPLETEPAEWTFTTALPRLLSVDPEPTRLLALDAALTLTFNQPVDPDSVEANLTLTTEQGEAVPYQAEWQEDGTRLVIQPEDRLARSSRYFLRLSGQAAGLGGTPLGVDSAWTFVTVGDLAVLSLEPDPAAEGVNVSSGFGFVHINLTAPLDMDQDLEDFVRLDPEVPNLSVYFSDPDGYSINVLGAFTPNQTYRLTLQPGLRDRWGQEMGEAFVTEVRTLPVDPFLTIPILQMNASAVFVGPGEAVIGAQGTNIDRVDLQARPAQLAEYLRLLDGFVSWPGMAGAESWSVPVTLPADRNTGFELPLTRDQGPLPYGLYAFSIRAPQQTTPFQAEPFFVVSSRIHLTLKQAQGELVAWAVDLETREPVSGLELAAWTSSGAQVGSGVTDMQGLAHIELPEDLDVYSPVTVVGGEPGQENFTLASSHWHQGISPWEFNIPATFAGSDPQIYLYTDRPIYRPGQTVYYRAVALQPGVSGYTPLRGMGLDVEAFGPFDMITGKRPGLHAARLTLSDYGTASGQFTLPENAPAGMYTLSTSDYPGAVLTFQVASYRKPEIDLQVEFAAEEILSGEDLAAEVQADYFFRGPADGVRLIWQLYTIPEPVVLSDGYQAGRLDLSWMSLSMPGLLGGGRLVAQGEGRTDANGRMLLSWEGAELAEDLLEQELQSLTLEVTLVDESALPVSARADVQVRAADFTIGVRPESWSGQAGEELGFSIRTQDWEGESSGGRRLRAEFQRVEWTHNWNLGPEGWAEFEEEVEPVGSTDFETGPDGAARLSYTPETPGTYRLVVGGEGALTEVLVWVGGAGMAPWPQLPNQRLELTTERMDYRPGDLARVFVPNPLGGEVLALVTVEREQVITTEILRLSGTSEVLEIPLVEAYAPNVYVTVTLLGWDSEGRADFRFGLLELPVSPVRQSLNLELEVQPEQAEPGEEVRLTLLARDADGRPVQGEFSLAAVDRAVLALADPNAPDILQAFYSRRPLNVWSSLALAVSADRIASSPIGGGGGGGDEGLLQLDPRAQFEDTAFWSAAVETDENGRAQVSFTLPDNLTTWVITARGLTGDARVGELVSELVTTKSLLVRPLAPRFFVAGDHVRLGAVVQNNTAGNLEARVQLIASGFSLDADHQPVQTVDLPAGGRQEVYWWGTAEDVEAVELIFRAEAGDLQDATTPAGGQVPVLRYRGRQTFGTTGILEQAGQELELVSLPRSSDPRGGELRVEMTPSLAALALAELEGLRAEDDDFIEPIISRLLANAQTYLALSEAGMEDRLVLLREVIPADVEALQQRQLSDGGWGWAPLADPDAHLTAYGLLALVRAREAGFDVSEAVVSAAQNYLMATLITPSAGTPDWQLNRLAFINYVLSESGLTNVPPDALLPYRERLSPSGQALLAAALRGIDPDSADAAALVENLRGSAARTATGASWTAPDDDWRNLSTPVSTTSVVVSLLAELDPSSPLLAEAARYLVANWKPAGGWGSSYTTAWTLNALTAYMRASGDAQASFDFAAFLNGMELGGGSAAGPGGLQPVQAETSLAQLFPDSPNVLVIERGEGPGRLYYRAYLDVSMPVEEARAFSQGIAVEREYLSGGQNCREAECTPIDRAELGQVQPVVARLTITLAEPAYNVVVEDFIPAGMEVANPQLNTTVTLENPLAYVDARDPFAFGWGWWRFSEPAVRDDSLMWTSDFLPAGTYQLVYYLTPVQPGEYQVLPARAWAYHFPEVQGQSAGAVFTIGE